MITAGFGDGITARTQTAGHRWKPCVGHVLEVAKLISQRVAAIGNILLIPAQEIITERNAT